jgi:N6-L-threonylcarbamoyladenine synthase
VPELASRTPQNIVPVIDAARNANIKGTVVSNSVYPGPGLMGSPGWKFFAKSMALAQKSLYCRNHMHAHILAFYRRRRIKPSFRFCTLTISGGHTQIVEVKDYFDF